MMLRAAGLTKRFGDIAAVNGVELALEKGEIVGLTGPDGAGKTTLLRLLTGVLPADSGQVQLPAEGFGYMPQRFSLYGEMSVQENLLLMGRLNGVADAFAAERIERILTLTHLWAFRDRLADNLSGGMKQKLALAAGLLHEPSLLILDEPTTGVDPVSRREFWQLLYQMNLSGMTILIATPYMDEAEYCHRVAFMANGVLREARTPAQLKAAYPYDLLAADQPMAAVAGTLHSFNDLVIEVHPMGARTHVAVTDADAFLEQWQQASALGAIWRKIEPSLEDVFLAMTEAVEHAGG